MRKPCTVVGASLTPAVEVAIEDKYDNTETDDDTDIISLTPSFIGSLDRTKSQTVTGGVTSFSDLSINQAANGYTLTASTTAGNVGSLTSNSFNITPDNVTTTAANVTANFSSNAQTVTLNATVANASVFNNSVNEGIVTFTVMNGSMTLGSTTGTVSGGKASANFSLPAGLAFGNYTIVVSYSDSQGNSIDNGDTNAMLAVVLLPTVTTNPSNQTGAVGGTVTFTAAATAYPPVTVQWRLSSDGGKTFSNINGATSATLTFNNVQASQNGYEYQAVFTNGFGTAATAAAILTIQYPPVVTTHPSNQTALPGQNVTFTTAANGNPIPTVQWQVSTDGGKTFSNISGATSTTLTLNDVTAAMNGYAYQAVFSNVVGHTASFVVTLTVNIASSTSFSAPVLIVPPLLALLDSLLGAVETVNANGTETITASLFGIALLESTYDESGNFVSASLFGVNIPNWVWFV